jgi:glycosyltransferase involved in cell wall biosynthesis
VKFAPEIQPVNLHLYYVEPSAYSCVPKPTLGALRNHSIDHAKGPLCLQWDSDDWHHPERIARQVQGYLAHPGQPVVLLRQLCYSFTDDTAFVREFDSFTPRPTGQVSAIPIVGTILFPKNDFRYPEKERSEDLDFYRLWTSTTVQDNDPALYIRLEHGHNTWAKQYVLRSYAGDWAKGGWHLSDRLREVIRDALTRYDVESIRGTCGWMSYYGPLPPHAEVPSKSLMKDIKTDDQPTVPMLETDDV